MPDTFRRREGALWHQCMNCSNWPSDGEYEEVRVTPPSPDAADYCPGCRQMIQDRDCSYVDTSTPGERAAKQRQIEGLRQHRIYGGGSDWRG